MKADPNVSAAMQMLARLMMVVELEKAGVRLTRQQHRRFAGAYPESALERIADLTSHITLVGPDGEVVSPAEARH